MLGALINIGARLASRYAFIRKWKNTFIVVGAVLLCAITLFLIDAKMYLSAGFVGILAAVAIVWSAIHYLRERHKVRERERRKLEQAAKRAAAAEARSAKIDKIRTTATGMAKDVGVSATGVARNVSGSAAGFVNVAKSGFSGARDKLGSWRRKSESGEPKS